VTASAPTILYGTAWKEDATAACVTAALAAGFRAIDTANQRKHYFEADVGRALAGCGIARAELFVQTKFTYVDGQDHRLPYDRDAPVGTQVAQSCASSLDHLGIDVIDSYVLHGPSRADGLAREDRDAWRAMEALVADGHVRVLGISNVNAGQVDELAAFARVAPAYVQNRCYASRGWDRDVRAACARHGIVYQGFSLLTANRGVVGGQAVRAAASRHAVTPAQVVLRFAQQVGMIPLSGTRDPAHMRDDVGLATFTLDADELARVEATR
jgi:diketogulonate reductase-like aldo/keto reductase